MFIEALILAIILGYIFKGKLKNLESVNLKRVYLIVIAFALEAVIIILIRKNMLSPGTLVYVGHLIVYILLFYFVYLNKKDNCILMMGVGFLLNAVPIFLNGGLMPVSATSAVKAGITTNVSKEGLYTIIDSNTRLWFLGDIIPKTILRHFVLSVGDIVIALGLVLFVVTGMRKKETS